MKGDELNLIYAVQLFYLQPSSSYPCGYERWSEFAVRELTNLGDDEAPDNNRYPSIA